MVYDLDRGTINIDRNDVAKFDKGHGASELAIEKNEIIEFDIDDYPEKEIAKMLKTEGAEYLVSVPIRSPKETIGAITVIFSSREKKLWIMIFLSLRENNWGSFFITPCFARKLPKWPIPIH